MDALVSDLRHVARSSWKRPGLTAGILLTLALGIGANTAVFSVVDGVLLRPLPYPSPERLVVVRTELPEQGGLLPRSAGPEIVDLRERAEALAALGGVWARPAALTDDASEPEEIEMGFVTAGFLSVFGVELLLGRDIEPAEDVDGAPPVVVLSHGLWERRYGANPEIVGDTVEMDGEPHRVWESCRRGSRCCCPRTPASPRRSRRSSHGAAATSRCRAGSASSPWWHASLREPRSRRPTLSSVRSPPRSSRSIPRITRAPGSTFTRSRRTLP